MCPRLSQRVDQIRRVYTITSVAGAICMAGCTGVVLEPDGDGPRGPSFDGPAVDDVCTDLGEPYLRRLTNAEYSQTLNDLFGTNDDYGAELPADAISSHGFDNHALINLISETHAERYRDIAEALSARVLADATSLATLTHCDLAADPSCLRELIVAFGRRAYRRPLSEEEVDRLVDLGETATDDPDPLAGAALVLQGMLTSPSFLLRIEVGEPVMGQPGVLKLTSFEMASSLAYTLWGTMPDDVLLELADRGGLETADQIREVARAMLAHPRAQPRLRSFASQWLQLGTLDQSSRDPERYPLWSAALASSMREGALRLIDEFVHGSASLGELLTAQHAYVDDELAQVYGTSAPATAFERIDLPEAMGRSGILASPALLTVSGHEEDTMAITRGKLVRQRFLCDTLPEPPPVVPQLPEPVPGQSERERLEQHSRDPACSGCHELMDPIGFALSRFDTIGVERTEDASGHPLDTSGELDGVTFDGAAGLAVAVRDNPKTNACVVRQLFRWAQGRTEVHSDSCTLEQLTGRFSESSRFEDLVIELVSSDAFRYRRANSE